MPEEEFQQQFQKCQKLLARGQKSNWGYEWFRAFEPLFVQFVQPLYFETITKVPGVGKKVELSATFLIQAASKVMPYMPKVDKHMSGHHVMSKLNDLGWWYDELTEMVEIISGEEPRGGAIEPMIRRKGSSTGAESSNSTASSTNTRKRPAIDDTLDETLTKKVANPSGSSRTPQHVASLIQTLASTSSLLVPKQTHAPGTSLQVAPEDADYVLDALDDIRDLFTEGIKRLDDLESTILRS